MASKERRLRVETISREATDVSSFTLVDPDGHPLPPWEAGAHLSLALRCGLVRQYSLCGDIRDRQRYTIAVLHEPAGRGGSHYLHTAVEPGDEVTVRELRNRFPLQDAKRYLFIAGGIGITPLLPMTVEADRRRIPWNMIYGGRTREAMAFRDCLDQRAVLVPQDERGTIDVVSALEGVGQDTLVYCCGPPGLIEAVRQQAAHMAVGDALRFELFRPLEEPDLGDGESFEVEFARTGLTFVVEPGESILDNAIAAGIDVEFDCRDGICGSCETPILEGRADHRDHVLDDDERAANASMMICVSRAQNGRIVLDL